MGRHEECEMLQFIKEREVMVDMEEKINIRCGDRVGKEMLKRKKWMQREEERD